MLFAEHDEMIEALLLDCLHEPFDEGDRVWGELLSKVVFLSE